MNDIEVSSIDLVEGGNVFKQGHYLTLGYVPRDEKGETVDLSGKTLNVALWGRKGVVFEAAATYSAGVIRFTLDKMVPAGDYTVEFTVTSSTDAKYRKKFPTNQHSGRIAIKQSADDLGVVGIQVYTVAQLKAEQKALLDAAVSGFTVDSETKMARVSGSTTYTSLPARLEADKQATAAQLEDKAGKDEARLKTVKINQTDLSDETLQQIAGNTPINAVPAKGSLDKERFKKEVVSPSLTDFVGIKKNLLNTKKNQKGFRIGSSGSIITDATYELSDYIAVEPSTAYVRKYAYNTAFYDSQFNPISTVMTVNFTTPSNCEYVRLSIFGTTVAMEQLEKGTVSTPHQPYEIEILNYIPPAPVREKFVDYDAYPFQPFATLTNQTEKTEIKKAVKRIDIIGVDNTKKYALGILQRNFSTYGTGAYLYEVDPVTGGNPQIVSFFTKVEYVEPNGIDAMVLGEYQSSGITAVIYVDWKQLSDNKQYLNTHYDKGGLDVRTHYPKPDTNIRLKLPPEIPAVVGHELNIYFDNVILANNLNDYQIDVVASVGTQQNERWTYTPDATGTHNVTIDIYKDFTTKVASATTSVIVKAKVGTGTKKALFIGDSTTGAGKYTEELLNLFGVNDPTAITLLGTRGVAPNLHEGRGGWTARLYTEESSYSATSNAFYNNGFDFSYYMTQQGYSSVDYVGIHLGINDVFRFTDDATLNTEIVKVLAQFKLMVDSIKAFNPAIKIGVMVSIPPSTAQDSFGKDYGSAQTKWRYKRNIHLFMERLIDTYKGRKAEGIYLVPVNVNLDTVNNMATESTAINSRNTTQIVRQSNGVHPADSGYYQMADIIYAWLKSFDS